MTNQSPYLLHHIVDRGIRLYPKQIAFQYRGEKINFEELFMKSNSLAAQLISLGVQKGDRVGVLMKRSLEPAIAIYGILRSGAAFVPLDPALPASRIQSIIDDCSLRVITINETIDSSKLSSLLVSNIVRVNAADDLSHQYTNEPIPNIEEIDLAYIMYTSGSTGIPKGIMHTHQSGLAYARQSGELYGLSTKDIVASIAPLHFDQCTFSYFSAPHYGAKSVIVSDAHLMMLASLTQLIANENISVLYSVPSLFIQLLDSKQIKKTWNNLRLLKFGGEPFPVDKLNQLIELLPNTIFSNVYGPAEVNQCTFKNFSSEISRNLTAVPIGKPWNDTEVRIVDEANKDVKFGHAGELLVRTPTMMTGYWNNELDINAFHIESSFQKKYYRTGDIVVYNEEGDLCFIGRKDRQIKIRGFRVELGAIEEALNKIDVISKSAVYIDMYKNEIHAAVVYQSGVQMSLADINKHLAKHLPRYCLPVQVHKLKDLPLTGNGKINYKLLENSMESDL